MAGARSMINTAPRIIHERSSGSTVESRIARNIFARFQFEQYKLRYTRFIGDVNSFKKVVESGPYGDCQI